jgi:hypothetical protein
MLFLDDVISYYLSAMCLHLLLFIYLFPLYFCAVSAIGLLAFVLNYFIIMWLFVDRQFISRKINRLYVQLSYRRYIYLLNNKQHFMHNL